MVSERTIRRSKGTTIVVLLNLSRLVARPLSLAPSLCFSQTFLRKEESKWLEISQPSNEGRYIQRYSKPYLSRSRTGTFAICLIFVGRVSLLAKVPMLFGFAKKRKGRNKKGKARRERGGRKSSSASTYENTCLHFKGSQPTAFSNRTRHRVRTMKRQRLRRPV